MAVSFTLAETNSSRKCEEGTPWKERIGFQPSIFRGDCLISGRVITSFFVKSLLHKPMIFCWMRVSSSFNLLVSTYLFVRCNNHKCVKTPLWRGYLTWSWLDLVTWTFMYVVKSCSWLILVQVPSLYLWLWEFFTWFPSSHGWLQQLQQDGTAATR